MGTQSNDSEIAASVSRNRNPISLAFLFYLVTLGAIVSASLRTLVDDESVTTLRLGVCLAVGTMMGLFIGLGVGIFHFRRLHATVAATMSSMLVGVVSGGLSLVRGEQFVYLSVISFVGCWILIAIVLIAARFRTVASL